MSHNTTLQIAIDGNEANASKRVGSNVYAFEILKALEKLLRQENEITVSILLREKPVSDMPGERDGWRYHIFGPKKLWTQWALPLHLFIHRSTYDLLFSPGHYVPHLCPIPYVSSVMDTAYLEYPESFKKKDLLQLSKWTQRAVSGAQKIIAISEATRESVVQHYDRSADDVVVAYPGYNGKKQVLQKEQRDEFFAKHNITKPFLLFVGTLQPRKNITTMIEAFEIFSRMIASRTLKSKKNRRKTPELEPAKLVLAGKVGWLADDILERIEQSPVKERIIRTGYVTEKQKGSLYEKAFASILVGLHEGFGIPPLESLFYKTPPVVSNTSSLPEVVGKAGFMADPTNPQEIAEAIWDTYTMNNSQKTTFIKCARKQLEKFSWDDSAKTILATLRQVGDNEAT